MFDNQVRIAISRHPLSDGSAVFNVTMGGVVLHAVSEDEASQLAEKMRDAIGAHTLEQATVSYL